MVRAPFVIVSSREILIHAAVGDKTYIMFDSGVRSASDVFKALAIGAKFVFVGRLWIWGLSIMGEHGVSAYYSLANGSSSSLTLLRSNML
jgi:isopentenyl diphosphate isomerase/L-lactate dehydrogenase-like FMN-dependent dehydrogenase